MGAVASLEPPELMPTNLKLCAPGVKPALLKAAPPRLPGMACMNTSWPAQPVEAPRIIRPLRIAEIVRLHGTERMRQKLFVAGLGVLVKTSAPKELAGLVACGIQLGGARLKE